MDILLIDDDVDDVELAMEVFTEYKLKERVRKIFDSEEASKFLLEANLNKQAPLLILLDLHMPKVGGLEVLKKIKSLPFLKSVPVIVFTSSREKKDIISAYELGANGYIVKSVEIKKFNSTVKAIIEFWILQNITN